MDTPDRSHIVRGRHAEEKVQQAIRFRTEMTPAEARLWESLRRSALNGLHFRRQQVIDGFIVDFYCHAAAMVVELDGAGHDSTRVYDDERTAILGHSGLLVLRFPNARVESDLPAVLSEIATSAAARLPEGVPTRRRRTAEERRHGKAPLAP